MISALDRRAVLLAVAALGLVAAGGGSYEAWRLFGRHYPRTPYDDLLSLLPDREAAAAVGTAYVAAHPSFESASATKALRPKLRTQPLLSVLNDDVGALRVVEAGHWIVPETLALLCALAAKA